MENLFIDPRGREIIIKITDYYILFYYAKQVRMHEWWLLAQQENEIEISEEDERVNEFYNIEKRAWINDFTNNVTREDNFHNHMRKKNWFTGEMYNFLNDSCKL